MAIIMFGITRLRFRTGLKLNLIRVIETSGTYSLTVELANGNIFKLLLLVIKSFGTFLIILIRLDKPFSWRVVELVRVRRFRRSRRIKW